MPLQGVILEITEGMFKSTLRAANGDIYHFSSEDGKHRNLRAGTAVQFEENTRMKVKGKKIADGVGVRQAVAAQPAQRPAPQPNAQQAGRQGGGVGGGRNGGQPAAPNTARAFMAQDTNSIMSPQFIQHLDNLHLFFNRYYSQIGVKEKSYDRIVNKQTDCFDGVGRAFGNSWDKLAKRQGDIFQAPGFLSNHVDFTNDYRMIVGLGGESVHEVNITLHHIYGIPYLPGSGFKGAVRSAALQEYFNSRTKGDAENTALADPFFELIFGSQNHRGIGIFLDVFPAEMPKLAEDVMTPHYGKYYANGEIPGDWMNPVPVKFLVMEKAKLSVHFALDLYLLKNRLAAEAKLEEGLLASLQDVWHKDPEVTPENLLACLTDLVRLAFEDYGVGAKTAIGYGYGDCAE